MKLLAIFLAMLGTAAAAQTTMVPCRLMPMETTGQVLADNYGESRQHGGLINSDMVAEVWVNDETGTWTLMLITPDGMACILAAGQYWQTYGPPKNPPNL
ncbi:hypothetical protein [Roseovarius amoyensis]|uniref:hypothetical protein n=1 Tax=Roseovarius amoyensis TaxID=2211448 RepID=UPI000DBE460A|nr:hypothetical protein [Roseovarius amoyensis]